MLKLSILAALCTLSVASPLAQRDVWDPPVLTPTEGSVLVSGTKFTVVWDTSNPPAEITDVTGLIALVQDGEFVTTGGDPNDILVLASGFNLTDGQAVVTIPSVSPGVDVDGFQFDLFGDSGNRSPSFTIINAA